MESSQSQNFIPYSDCEYCVCVCVCMCVCVCDLWQMAMRVFIFRKATWNENQKQLSYLQVRRKVNKYVLMAVNKTNWIVLDTDIDNMGQWDVFENETDSFL